MFADKIESEKSKTRKRQPPPPSASTAVLILLIIVSFYFSLSLDPSSKQWLLPVHDFLWHLTGGLGASFFSISSSFSAPLLPQLVIGDCNFVGLVGLAYSLAWLSSACLFSVTFRISFHVIARAWQQFQLGPSFWSVFKAQLATTSLPLRSPSPLGPLDPLARCRRQYALWSLAYCMKFVYTHTHTCMLGVCLCVCMFIRLSMSMNESSSKLRIKVYYFLFGSLLFSADLYNNFLHPSSLSADHTPCPSHFFQKPSSDCLRIVASLQFEFLRDLHKSFRPHNSTEIAVYSVWVSLSCPLSSYVCFPSYYIYRNI